MSVISQGMRKAAFKPVRYHSLLKLNIGPNKKNPDWLVNLAIGDYLAKEERKRNQVPNNLAKECNLPDRLLLKKIYKLSDHHQLKKKYFLNSITCVTL